MRKSKWYLTVPVENGVRSVLMQYGGFSSMKKADAITWQFVGETELMERKPEFSGVLPVKGERILAHPRLYVIGEEIVYKCDCGNRISFTDYYQHGRCLDCLRAEERRDAGA